MTPTLWPAQLELTEPGVLQTRTTTAFTGSGEDLGKIALVLPSGERLDLAKSLLASRHKPRITKSRCPTAECPRPR